MYYCEGMFTASLPTNRSLRLRGADHIENTSVVLLTACVLDRVYSAVAWQRADKIRYDIKELGCEGVERVRLAQDKVQGWVLVNMVMNLRIP
jgi:hypothetical protein